MTLARLRDMPRLRLITRACFNEQFLLTPTEKLNSAFRFHMSNAAEKHDIGVHFVLVTSNRYYSIVSENSNQSDLSGFYRDFHTGVSRYMNNIYGRRKPFWDDAKPAEDVLLDEETVIKTIVKILLSVVESGEVHSPHSWPGIVSLPKDLTNLVWTEDRPPEYAIDSKYPEITALKFAKLPFHSDADTFRAFVEKLDKLLKQVLKDLKAASAAAQSKQNKTSKKSRSKTKKGKNKSKGKKPKKKFLGAKKILKRKWYARPAPRPGFPKQSPVRPVTGENTLAYENYERDFKRFQKAYRKAWREWILDRETLFPIGTYKMRVVFGAQCASADNDLDCSKSNQ